jgi:hypothetical protein
MKGEAEVVHAIRSYLVDAVDWDCDLKTNFRGENLGCGLGPSKAISWFFSQEEAGIILEDDCLPDPSFFTFCEELLDYYQKDKRVMHISGDQFIEDYVSEASYYFAKIPHGWGWATWADRWATYDFEIKKLNRAVLKNFSDHKSVQNYWGNIMNEVKATEIDAWDYQWAFTIVSRKGLCINPSKNLVSNIGFGENSTHTGDIEDPFAGLPTYNIGKLIHPDKRNFDMAAVDYIYKYHFGIEV